MIILAIKTDEPEAELWLYDGQKKLVHHKWQGHKRLAETIHTEIKKILDKSSISLRQVSGIACFKGPGSFTGLRIGFSIANTLAYSQQIPIVTHSGSDWLKRGIDDLLNGKNDKTVLPKYGAPANTSKPKK